MKNTTRTIPASVLLFSITTAALVTACGGGGGSGSFVSNPVSISNSNAQQVAADSALVSGAMNGTSSGGGGVSVASVGQDSRGLHLTSIIEHSLKRVGGSLNSTQRSAAASQDLPGVCATGSATINVLSSASASVTFINCVDSTTSETINGMLLFSHLIVGTTSASGQLSTSDLNIADGQHLYALSGSANFTDNMPSTIDTFTMSGGSLVITIDGSRNTLSSFTMSLVEDQNTLAYTTSLDGLLDSDALGGHVTIDTTTAFQGVNIEQNDPDSGSMVVHGDSNSSITITATGSGNVTLDVVDSAGVSTTINTTWSSLEQTSLL